MKLDSSLSSSPVVPTLRFRNILVLAVFLLINCTMVVSAQKNSSNGIERYWWVLLYFWWLPVLIFLGIISKLIYRLNVKNTEKRSLELDNIVLTNLRNPLEEVDSAMLLSSNIVISVSYIQRFFATFRFLIGGRIRTIEPLFDWGRKEVLVRLKEQAKIKFGINQIHNVRIETSSIGTFGKSSRFEIIAYGTGTTK